MNDDLWTVALETGKHSGSVYSARGTKERPPQRLTASDLMLEPGKSGGGPSGVWLLDGFDATRRTASYVRGVDAPSPKEQYREQVAEEELSDWGEGALRDLRSDQ